MSSWFVYIALSNDDLLTGITNDLVIEESLLKKELNDNTLIQWYQEFETKTKALKRLQEINNLSDVDKKLLTSSYGKLIIFKDDKEDMQENYSKFPLIYNLKQTLKLSSFFNTSPEIWKLDDLYLEDVTEYLSIKKTQIEYSKLWDISIDYSVYVGLVTNNKFFPIIKY